VLSGDLLYRFLHRGVGCAVTDRSETPRNGRSPAASDGTRTAVRPCGAGSSRPPSTFGLMAGIVSAKQRCRPVGRPGASHRSCVASLSEPVERERACARHPQEGQQLLRRRLRRHRSRHRTQASPLGSSRLSEGRRRAGAGGPDPP
jgi:hypothetical protein